MLKTIIAPRINLGLGEAGRAIRSRSEADIARLVQEQIEAFERYRCQIHSLETLYIDVEIPNSNRGENNETVDWVVKTVKTHSRGYPLCLGHGDLTAALIAHDWPMYNEKDQTPIANSINWRTIQAATSYREIRPIRLILMVNGLLLLNGNKHLGIQSNMTKILYFI